ncbi:MAG: hypothetical protein FJY07_11390 [Bacteroidetes bacterium]|nr:hypothetical protein [Bacteroidota bacterium]
MFNKTLTSLLFLLFGFTIHAQDSLISKPDSLKVYYFLNNFETKGPDFLTQTDTVITGIQKYDPLAKPGNYYCSLGNSGLASVSMVFKPHYKSGFEYHSLPAFENYRFQNDSLQYYWVGKPFTHLSYVMGAKKEQNILIDHSQNAAPWFNFGLTFRYTNSPGYYSNEKSDDKNFVLKSRFQTRDYRYMVLANYIHNKIQPEENGGIKYDSAFEQNTEENRRNIEVNLNTAQNIFRENSYYVKQLFFIPAHNRFGIGERNDTVQAKKISAGNISLSTLYSRITHLYKQDVEDNHGFYRFTHDSVNPTYDSTFTGKIENQVSWTNSDNSKPQLLTFNFALKHLYAEVKEDSSRAIINQLIPSGEMNFSVSDILRLSFTADYVTGNVYTGDYHLSGSAAIHSKFGDLSYSLTNALQETDRFYLHYSSNHFRWDNPFRKTSYVLNSIACKFKTLFAGVNLYSIGSFVYLDTLAMPAQMGDNLNVMAIYLHKLTNIGNWSFDVRGVYQSASNSALRVPQLTGDVSIYYTNDLFKKATILQAGIDVFYNTAYFG